MVGTLVGTLVLLAQTSPAAAFCRTTECNVDGVQGARCFPEETRQTDAPIPPDCGNPIGWARSCIGFSVHDVGAPTQNIDAALAKELLLVAFASWTEADCGNGITPSIKVRDLGLVSCGQVEYNQQAGNANILIFRNDVWPYEGNINALALTTVSFDIGNGEIYDTDIEVNTADRIMQIENVVEGYDLVGVLTHEAGHALGLAHTGAPGATMTTTIQSGNTELRSLEPDDVTGVCTAYPPGAFGEICNPVPRHGFSPDCEADQVITDCSVTEPPSEALSDDRATLRHAWMLGFVGLVVALRRWRRSADA